MKILSFCIKIKRIVKSYPFYYVIIINWLFFQLCDKRKTFKYFENSAFKVLGQHRHWIFQILF